MYLLKKQSAGIVVKKGSVTWSHVSKYTSSQSNSQVWGSTGWNLSSVNRNKMTSRIHNTWKSNWCKLMKSVWRTQFMFQFKKITNKMRRTLAQKIFLGLLLLHIWGSQHLVVTEPHISCSWHQLDQAWKYSGSWLEGMTGGTTVDRGDSEFSLLTQACLQCCCCCCWKWAETQGEDPPCLRMLKNV